MQRTPAPTSSRAKLALALVMVLAVVLRLAAAPAPGGLAGGFDREMDGFQGSCFAIIAVNYERLGLGAVGGYPVINVDVDPDAPETWYAYANHPPTLALALWLELKLFGPEGWSEAPLTGASPMGVVPGRIEALMRLPMLLASLASILALFWALRAAMDENEALLATLLYATAPLAVLDAGLVNYEPLSILCVVVAYGAAFRYLTHGRRRHLVLAAAALALGTAQTFAPLFFALPLCLFALAHGRRKRPLAGALVAPLVLGLAALLPILIHGAWARHALRGISQPVQLIERVGNLFEPLTSGAVPLFGWLGLQLTHLADASSELLRDLMLLGLLFCAIDLLAAPAAASKARAQADRARAASLAVLLFAGGLSSLFFFYRHTADGFVPGSSAQTTFMLNLLPGACALAAVALFEIARTLARVFQKGRPKDELSLLARHGPGILVTAILLITLGDFARRTTELYQTWRAPDPARPLPAEVGAELNALLPPGAIGLFPAEMGLTPAHSLYAWRTLLPVTADVPSFQFAEARLAASGLVENPRYLLLPTPAPPAAAKSSAALETLLHEMAPRSAAEPPRASAHWRAWRLVGG